MFQPRGHGCNPALASSEYSALEFDIRKPGGLTSQLAAGPS
jgi:hypothetical protein